MMVVRQMTVEDIPAVAEIERTCFLEPWSEEGLRDSLSRDYARFLVCDVEGVVVGYVGLYVLCSDGDITNVAVLPAYRGMGVATSLMERIHDYARERGVDSIKLECRTSNRTARALYERLGYIDIGTRPHFYADGESAIMYEKRLAEV